MVANRATIVVYEEYQVKEGGDDIQKLFDEKENVGDRK
jgi:hypothetical protein